MDCFIPQHAPVVCRKSVAEHETTQKTKYASAETSAREWAEVTAKANMHKGKWSEYWEQAKIAGDMGNEKVCFAAPVFALLHNTLANFTASPVKVCR